MQRKKYLEKTIVLSLLLAGISVGQVNATPIASGTQNIGGAINLTETYVNATDNVTLNATSDVNMAANNNTVLTTSGTTTGKTIAINMNNYNFTAAGTGPFIDISQPNNIQVLNANDIKLVNTATSGAELSNTAVGGEIIFQANHDFIVSAPQEVSSAVFYTKNANKISITAGHDINFDVVSNSLDICHAGTVCYVYLTAGNDIILKSGTKGYANFVVGDAGGSIAELTAQNGSIQILSTGGSTGAASIYGPTHATFTAAKDITIGGNTQRGLRVVDAGGIADLTSKTGKITITATNTSAKNNAGIYTGAKAKALLHSDTYVSAVTTAVDSTGEVTFDKNATITDAATGILSQNGGAVTVNGDATITSTTTEISANKGAVTLAKAATLSGGATAIAATNGGTVTANSMEAAKKITGNITSAGAGSSVDLAMGTTDSYLTGTTTSTNSGALKVNLANGGVWNVTGTSSLTDLVNNSTVNMRYTGNSTNETITTANLSGNGTYVMNTDVEASYDSKNVQSNGDKIIITTSSSGNNILELRDVSLDRKLESQGYLLLVEDQSNGSATFSGKDLAHGGIFKYKPVITTANPTDYSGFNTSAKNWYLTGFEKTIVVSDNTKATLGLGETRYANYFMDQDTLLKRLGELRGLKGEPEQDGIWARYRHGGMDGSGFSGGSSMVQVGYDKKTANKRYTGFAFNHTSSTYDFDGGSTGEGSLDALTVYNTWLGDKNHYFDIVGKLGKMRGNSTYEDSLFPEKGNYDSWFCSISGEYGRKNIDKNGWYYEPQAQLTLGRIRGDDYTTGLGTKVNMASITSLISRAGVTFGKEYNMKNSNTHSNIYGKINWLHEFKGDANTNLRDSYGDSYDHKTENSGSWWNAGFGATINVNKNTHMYLDFEKNFGGEVTTNWIGQLGCQWTWK